MASIVEFFYFVNQKALQLIENYAVDEYNQDKLFFTANAKREA